jgi:hypothetical protein
MKTAPSAIASAVFAWMSASTRPREDNESPLCAVIVPLTSPSTLSEPVATTVPSIFVPGHLGSRRVRCEKHPSGVTNEIRMSFSSR